MADDSHKIIIESDHTETVKYVTEGTPPDLEAATQSHLRALQGEGDIPGTQANPVPSTPSPANDQDSSPIGSISNAGQISSDEAFGPGGLFPGPDLPKAPSNNPIPPNSGSSVAQEAVQASTASAVSGAGAAAAKSSPGLLASAATTAGSALSKLGGAVSSVLPGLASVAIEAGYIGAAFAGFTGALTVATQLLDSTFKALASNWADISPSMAAAQGQSEMELTAHKLRTEYRVSQDATDVTAARTDLHMTFLNLSATVINTIGPALTTMMETLSVMLEIMNLILRAINAILSLFGPIPKLLTAAFKWVRDRFPDNSSKGGNITDKIMNQLVDRALLMGAVETYDADWKKPQGPKPLPVNL